MSELKPIEQEVTELMNAHAKLLSEDLPEGYGFALLAYKHGKPDEHRHDTGDADPGVEGTDRQHGRQRARAAQRQAMTTPLLPCPFCGGPVEIEQVGATVNRYMGPRRWYGVTCRNAENRGGTCAMEIRPQASIEAATERWNMRDGKASDIPDEIFLLFSGDSPDGRGPAEYVGRTADPAEAYAHYQAVRADPYSTGGVTLLTASEKRALGWFDGDWEKWGFKR
jgi:hypothetical protein